MEHSKESQEYLKCKICFEWFDEKDHRPLILQCGHTFCQSCIISIIEGTYITCPMDKKLFEYTNFKDIGTNYSLLEKIIKEQSHLRVHCEEHGNIVHFFCRSDETFACKNCVLQIHTGMNHELLPAQKIIQISEFLKELPNLVNELEDAISFMNFQIKVMGIHKENFVKREKKLREEIMKIVENCFSESKERVFLIYQGLNDSLNRRLNKLKEEKQKALITQNKFSDKGKWAEASETVLKEPTELKNAIENEIKLSRSIYLENQQRDLIDCVRTEAIFADLIASLKIESERVRQESHNEEIINAETVKGALSIGEKTSFFPFVIMNPYNIRGLAEFRKYNCFDVVLNCLMNVKDLANYYIAIRDKTGAEKAPLSKALQGLFKEFWLGLKPQQSKKEIKSILNEKSKDPFELTLSLLKIADLEMHNSHNESKKDQKLIQDLFKGIFRSSASKLMCLTCKINSDKIICPFVLDLNLPKYRVLVQGFFYLIFQDPETLPLKVQFALPQEFHAEDLFLKINEKFNISPDNLELFLMKDHILIERPQRKVSLKYLKRHEGLLIIFETRRKNNSEKVCLDDEQQNIFCEVVVKQITSPKTKNATLISFPRLVLLKNGDSLEKLHLSIYNLIRQYLKETRFVFEEEDGDSVFKEIIGTIGSENHLRREYEKMFNGEKEKPYELFFQRANNIEIEKIPFENKIDVRVFFGNLIQNNRLGIQLLFSPYITRANLKINRCHESNKSIMFNKRTHSYCLEDCLKTFQDEVLQHNKFYCDNCYSIQKSPLVFDDIISFPKILLVTFRSKIFEENEAESPTLITFPVDKELNINMFLKKSEKSIDSNYELCSVINLKKTPDIRKKKWNILLKNFKNQEWFKMVEGKYEPIDKDLVCSEYAYLLVFIRK